MKKISEDDVYSLLQIIQKLQNQLNSINGELNTFKRNLENLAWDGIYCGLKNEYRDEFTEETTEEVKYDAVFVAKHVMELFNQRDEIADEMKELYKEIFFRENSNPSFNCYYGWIGIVV